MSLLLVGEARPEFLRDELLHEIVEATACKFPGRTAIRCNGKDITYGELLRRSQGFARILRARGLGRGERVPLWMTRGAEMYVAMLGILEAGCTYVPIDPSSPTERALYIATDCGAKCVVASQALVPPPGETDRVDFLVFEKVPAPETDASGEECPRIDRGDTGVTPDDCAYVIYTSGTTGRPKGVMVSHRSICHFVHSEGSVLALQPDDIVFQGASLSFDMSLEEIWPAWAVGATLWVGTAEVMAAGSDLSTILEREKVTVWTCVPTLLAMQENTVSTLRLLNLGGEACPPQLVQRWWRPGIRILNTYGPTEATITATYEEVVPEMPITIGRPLPNYTAVVLDDAFHAVPRGETGELCIGGPGLAAGYLGRTDLTAERFIPSPFAGKGEAPQTVYRTGDLARITPEGKIEFLGRIDTQVKIRGHRVELGEIEAVLLEDSAIKQAAVVLRRDLGPHETIVAYLVIREGITADLDGLPARMKKRVSSYMVPEIFEPLAELPTLPSGKVDRNRLPLPRRPAPDRAIREVPTEEWQRLLHEVARQVFSTPDIGVDDDFFDDLGCHSLRAALFVSALRKHPKTQHVSMMDVYKHRSIAALATHLRTTAKSTEPEKRKSYRECPTWRYVLCAIAQGLGLLVVYGLFSLQWLIPYFSYAWLYNTEEFTRGASIAISLGFFISAIPVMWLVGIAAKWLVLGRLKPGEYPLWGFTFYRWWLSQRLLDTVPIQYLGGTPLLSLYLRLLGARVGRGVHVDGGDFDAPDCLEIGDGACFAPGTTISCCKVEDGMFKVGRVKIGAECHIGASSVVGMNATMHAGAELEDLSALPPGQTIPAHERWSGSPARFRQKIAPVERATRHDGKRRALFPLYALLLLVFPLFAVLPIFPGMILMIELDQNTDAYSFILLSPALALVFVLTMCLQIAGLKWLLVGKVKAGRIPLHSFGYVRQWLVQQLMQLSLDVVNPLYATLYLNPWYRILGVRLGKRAEISTASSISYDLLHVGEESFVADGVSLGAPRVYRGALTLEPTSIGRRAFVGNSAVIPSGTTLGDGVLVGVLSAPPRDPADCLRRDSSWFGSPAIFLPERQTSTTFQEETTFRPTRSLVCKRLAIEFIRVILPLTVVIALTSLMMSFVVDLSDADWSLGQIAVAFPLLYVAYGLGIGAFVVALKWLIVGRYRPVEKPLWCGFVWRTELVTSTYENLAVPFFSDMLRGTPFLSMYLRALGCKIGRKVFLDTTDITEFDLVRIADGAALNNNCGPQTHLFEDRVMKISQVDIGSRCTVGAGSVVLYDATMEDESELGELSLVMKGETLPRASRWIGSPARTGAA